MVVVCKHALVIANTGKNVEVQPFSPDCKTMESVPILNAVVKWTYPHTDKMHLLLMKNALHVPSMSHNLIPPFVMREAAVPMPPLKRVAACAADVHEEPRIPKHQKAVIDDDSEEEVADVE